METTPKLSDLVRDWAEAGGWPITVTASEQFKPLCWVETAEKIPIQSADTLLQTIVCNVYIGTIHDDAAYFASATEIANDDIVASHPDFFRFIAQCIVKTYDLYPQLDKSKLPYGGDKQRILASCTF